MPKSIVDYLEEKLNEIEEDLQWYKEELRREQKLRWDLEEEVERLKLQISPLSPVSPVSPLPNQQI
jgi:archaellum component FlaC